MCCDCRRSHLSAVCVCVFVWPGITQTCRCTRLTVSCKVNLRNCTFVCAFKFSRNICCVSVIPALIYTFLGGVTASLYIDKSLFFFFCCLFNFPLQCCQFRFFSSWLSDVSEGEREKERERKTNLSVSVLCVCMIWTHLL